MLCPLGQGGAIVVELVVSSRLSSTFLVAVAFSDCVNPTRNVMFVVQYHVPILLSHPLAVTSDQLSATKLQLTMRSDPGAVDSDVSRGIVDFELAIW